MAITTVSSRELNQDIGKAKRAAQSGPVVITDRGRDAYVLLTADAYRKLVGEKRSLIAALSMPGVADVEFEVPKAALESRPPAFD